METKTAPAMTVLSCEIRTNLKSLVSDVGDLNKQIFVKAIENGFQPTGPQCWIYKWESIDPNADFQLRITLPVATFGKNMNDDVFSIQNEKPFYCVSTIHNGAFENLKDTYANIMEYMNSNSLVPGNICREYYLNCDFEQTENCVTEVQFGLN